MFRTAIGAATAAFLGLAIQTGPANAVPTSIVACGNITSPGSYILDNNLVSAGGDCIVVLANAVTIDLDGHTIGKSGGAAGAGISVPFGSGIRGTVIRNGSITLFTDGIQLSNAGDGTVVENIRAIGNNGFGIHVPDGSIVRDSVAHANNGRGIEAGTGSLVIHNSVTDSGFEGIVAGPQSSVIENVSRDNTGDGINVLCEANVIGNTSSNNGGIAINLLLFGCNDVNNIAVP